MVEASPCSTCAASPPPQRPITFGALAGLGIGTIGLAAEWVWSHVWVVNPWPASLFPEGAITGLIAALAGGVIGGFVGRCADPGGARAASASRAPSCPSPPWPRSARSPSGSRSTPGPASARPSTSTQNTPDGRVATGTVQLDPPDAADDACWFNVTSWQGKDGPPRSTRWMRSARAATGSPSRSPSTAPGRRPCACTRAASSPACRSSCRPTRRSRSRRSRSSRR